MRDQPMNPPEPTDPSDLMDAAANAAFDQQNHELDQRLIRALESAPELRIPADFTSRVTSQLPERLPATVTPTYFGYGAIVISVVALLIALLVLAGRAAMHTPNHSIIALVLQWTLCAQFIALAVWLGLNHRTQS
jgi:hypothetical protein